MKISCLLEAKAYRYQDRWAINPEDVIDVPGRTSRESTSSILPVYAMTYGLKLNGIECPKRWRSTFATTSIGDSYFMSVAATSAKAIRELEIPPGVKVGVVSDDFNRTTIPEYPISGYIMTANVLMSTVISTAKRDGDQYTDQIKIAEQRLGQIAGAMRAIPQHKGTDVAYETFVYAVECLDEAIQAIGDSLSKKPEWMQQHGGLSSKLKHDFGKMYNEGVIKVFDSIEAVPEGNFEAWFEGPYRAIKLPPEAVPKRKNPTFK